MKTGTDISLRVCRESGYPVVEHFGAALKPDKPYLLTISYPHAWSDRGYPRPGHSKLWQVFTRVSYSELWRMFERHGAPIKAYCDFDHCPFPTPAERPSFSDFANLAGILFGYSGELDDL